MDIYGLAATHTHPQRQPGPMNAQTENRYYAGQFGLRPLHPGIASSIAMMVGIVLFLGTTLF